MDIRQFQKHQVTATLMFIFHQQVQNARFNPLKDEAQTTLFKDPVRTVQ